MIGRTPTRDGRSSSIGDARIFWSISSESWPFGSRANTLRSSGGGAAAGAIDAAWGAMAAEAIFILDAPQPAVARRTARTKANAAVVFMPKQTRGSRVAYRAAVFAVISAESAV